MLSLEITKENANEIIIKNCIPHMIRLYKEDFDAKLNSWSFSIDEEDENLVKKLLMMENLQDALEQINILRFIASEDFEIEADDPLVKFYEYIVRTLYLSEFEPDKLCLEALDYFQDIYGIEYCSIWPNTSIQIKLHEDVKHKVLQQVSAEMKPYIREEVSGFKEICEWGRRLKEKMIQEVMKISIIKKPGTERTEINS